MTASIICRMRKAVFLRVLGAALGSATALFSFGQKWMNIPLANKQTLQLGPGMAPRQVQPVQAAQGEQRYYWAGHVASLPALRAAVANGLLQPLSQLAPQTLVFASRQLPAASSLAAWGLDAVGELPAQLKLDAALAAGRIASHAKAGAARVRVLVSCWPDAALPAAEALRQAGFQPEWSPLNQWRVYPLQASLEQVQQLSRLPFVAFVQTATPPEVPLNEASRTMSAASPLRAPQGGGGRGLLGRGIVMGVGDDADPTLHPDVSGRIFNHSPGIVNDHGAHVTGTVAGGGILLAENAGYAPLASIVSQWFSGVWQNAATYVQDYNMLVTNNSYANVVGDCSLNGVYDLTSKLLDDQAFSFPQLLHVFASGNDGEFTCSPYPFHYATVLTGLQTAKNVITVGRTDYIQLASSSSSSGPVKDGRLKPEIVALGEAIISMRGNYSYGFPYFTNWGTSMAAPAVTGGLGLLHERYKQLFSNANAPGDLMKALLLNGARDIGTPGPDYRHGYGMMHLENSLRMLESSTYSRRQISHAQVQDTVITVPAGTQQLKVMLYWHDPAASPLAARALVNDLDLEVITPGGSTIYPLILNSTPAGVTAAAQPGIDRVNNSEQVVISTPVAGNYTLRVRGYDVGVNGPQWYALVFDAQASGIQVSTPFAGEVWSPSPSAIPLNWDYRGSSNNPFTLEYSLDGGTNWTVIDANVAAATRYYQWFPPANTIVTNARVRISKNGTGESFTTGLFSIINPPITALGQGTQQCEGYINIIWTAIPGADGYEVVMLRNGSMQPVATLGPAATSYTLGGLSKDTTYYMAVQSIKNGVRSRSTLSQERRPNTGLCNGSISDFDLALDSIPSPVTGRQFTSSALSANSTLQIRIKNLDDAAASAFSISYSINGSPFVSTPVTAAVAAGATYTHSIPGVDLSAAIDYNLVAVVTNTAAADVNKANDTLRTVIRHLANAPISLAAPFTDGFESAAVATLDKGIRGLAGTQRWDYSSADIYGRLRTRAFSGIARSGQRAITMDVSKAFPLATNPINYLTGTFNLSNPGTTNEIRLDFWFKQHGFTQAPHPQNKVWVRGTETDPWVELYDLGNNHGPAGEFKQSPSLELQDVLAAAGQSMSSSTQVRFGQFAFYAASDNRRFGGYSFDDVQLYAAQNDAQLVAIDTPFINSCGLSAATPVRIRVRNSMNQALTNVPVSYRVNGGAVVNETIASIAANTTVSYTFSSTANLQTTGTYLIEAAVAMPGDNVSSNNEQSVSIVNQPVIASFPYLQNFESGAGNWYAYGTNSSWQLGSPASRTITAAASGTNAWKTTLVGNYNDNEQSYLQSPCFDINSMAQPTLSFAFAYDMEDCRAFNVVCDAAWVEYSYNGQTWTKLGTAGSGTNWYDFAPAQVWMGRNRTVWRVASFALPRQAGNIRLRIVVSSDDGVNREGIAIDDIHIFDNTPIYTGPGNSLAQTLAVSGTNPVHFVQGGKIMASLWPNGNNLGNTEVQTWLHSGAVRNDGSQYYANRNITVKPAQAVGANPVTVRLYFTDVEAEQMRQASGCANCTAPAAYNRLNISKYTDANRSQEDGQLTNNSGGTWRSIANSQIVFVPYDSGYYAQFEVSDFSELWLTDGNFNIPLPATWLRFDASAQSNGDALLSWQTANEQDVQYYEIEVAADGRFEAIGRVAARNAAQASYQFTDSRAGKRGTLLYRIKRVDRDGTADYSMVRSLRFGQLAMRLQLQPNPAQNATWVQLSGAPAGQRIGWRLNDAAGRVLQSGTWIASGAAEKWRLPLQGLPAGTYLLSATDGQQQWQEKLLITQQ